MKSEWMVERSRVDGKTQYRVYRMRDADKPDIYPNREYYGEPTTNRRAALSLVEWLIDKEEGE